MATEKLYYQDAHQAAFEARVVSCQPGKHGYDVVLDRTCFYPEGGGQPGDTGFLSGVRVTDTHERGGEIVHFCEQPLAEGQTTYKANLLLAISITVAAARCLSAASCKRARLATSTSLSP